MAKNSAGSRCSSGYTQIYALQTNSNAPQAYALALKTPAPYQLSTKETQRQLVALMAVLLQGPLLLMEAHKTYLVILSLCHLSD
jgi:hypothetical protein